MKAIKQTDFYQLFHQVILTKDCRQRDAMSVLREVLNDSFQNRVNREVKILDFGCGASCPNKKILEDLGLNWAGVDIESKNPSVIFYDDKQIPFQDELFDIVFSRQVLEHVTHPDLVISEINRVTKKQGYFVGSVAQLEPFHQKSIYNMSPLALKYLLERNGFTLKYLAAGMDYLSLLSISIARGIFGRTLSNYIGNLFSKSESILNRVINVTGWLKGLSKKEINMAKLKFAGYFCYVAKKI